MSKSTDLDASNKGGVLALDRKDPLKTARLFRRACYMSRATPDGKPFPTLVFNMDEFFAWDGVIYRKMVNKAIRSRLYLWLEKQVRVVTVKGEEKVTPFQPNSSDADRILDALKAITLECRPRPTWLGKDECPFEMDYALVAKNGIFDLKGESDEVLMAPTPLFFGTNALTYPYESNPEPALAWALFLKSIWPEDQESIDLLQEWMGYCLTQETRQQKILMLIGPPRSGKGTICRVMTELLGKENACGPTFGSLARPFGLKPLLDKTLAVIPDARLGGKDQSEVLERLLTISGEDTITIDRKFIDEVTVKLRTRLMICTNELPRLNDASGALANRFLILQLERSFLGTEDVGLTDRLLGELPGILKWSIDGWRRLQKRGRFEQTQAGRDAIEQLDELASPVRAFVKDWCVLSPGASVKIKELYEAWTAWCSEQGRHNAGDVASFGRNLNAAAPGLRTTQPRDDDGKRPRCYEGIGLTLVGKQSTAQHRSSQGYAA